MHRDHGGSHVHTKLQLLKNISSIPPEGCGTLPLPRKFNVQKEKGSSSSFKYQDGYY
jgi:hypothetical protein